MKTALGIIVAFAVGFACRSFGIPSPAPPVVTGALIVMAMTLGYAAVDRVMATRARHANSCGGPSGQAAPSGETS
jgi:XapX domain-containing protein